MTTFVLTGATGLIGSHLLFEIIRQHLSRLDQIRILVLGRHQGTRSLRERIEAIFRQGGYSYLDSVPYDRREVEHFLRHGLSCFELSLDRPGEGEPELLRALRQAPIDHFFHLAALPDLRNRPEIEARVMKTNYEGTQRLLELVGRCEVQEFDFVGTAFVCGRHSGVIAPDFSNPEGLFNNPYERSKLMAEMAVREFAERNRLRYRIFRPSIVCGRLLEQPLGYVSKFDVFYQLFGALHVLKALYAEEAQQSTELPLRVVFAPESSANFVPVDYLVKLLYQVCGQQAEGNHFHLVNEQNSRFGDFLTAASEEMQITGVQGVSTEPMDKTPAEEIYYNRVGGLFEAYLNSAPKLFDTTNEQEVIRRADLRCPPMSHENIRLLIRYAVQQDFGFQMQKVLTRLRA